MTNIYFVAGAMQRDIGIIDPEIERKCISQEIEADSDQAAIDFFEVDGWEFVDTPTVKLITEAQKLERLGAPSLFPLPPKGLNDDHSRY